MAEYRARINANVTAQKLVKISCCNCEQNNQPTEYCRRKLNQNIYRNRNFQRENIGQFNKQGMNNSQSYYNRKVSSNFNGQDNTHFLNLNAQLRPQKYNKYYGNTLNVNRTKAQRGNSLSNNFRANEHNYYKQSRQNNPRTHKGNFNTRKQDDWSNDSNFRQETIKQGQAKTRYKVNAMTVKNLNMKGLRLLPQKRGPVDL